jgi:nitrate reductase alpha subunit
MKAQHNSDPVKSWDAIQADPVLRSEYQKVRGRGGFVRAEWDEVNEIIAAANIYTIKKHGPDRDYRFFAYPRDVNDFLCRRLTVFVADWRRVHEFL